MVDAIRRQWDVNLDANCRLKLSTQGSSEPALNVPQGKLALTGDPLRGAQCGKQG
jgi:hypothetical protein